MASLRAVDSLGWLAKIGACLLEPAYWGLLIGATFNGLRQAPLEGKTYNIIQQNI